MPGPRPFEQLTWRGQVQRLRALAREGLARFGLSARSLACQGHWENATFRAELPSPLRPTSPDHDPLRVLVRVHRPGHQSAAAIASELDWLDSLDGHRRLAVPRPVRRPDGEGVVSVTVSGVPESRLVSVLRWLPGALTAGRPRGREDDLALGEAVAQLHAQARSWKRPPGFFRRRRDAAGMFGGDLSADGLADALAPLPRRARALVARAIGRGREAIEAAESSCGTPLLIHGDLHARNLLRHPAKLGVIDFDDCGVGSPALDVAIALNDARHHPEWPARLAAFREGHARVVPLAAEVLEALDGLCVARSADWLLWAGARSVDNPAFAARLESWTELVQDRLRRLGC